MINLFAVLFSLFMSGQSLAQFSGSLPPVVERKPSQASNMLIVKIGHVGPTSGLIGHLGKDNENGARMAIEELNASGFKIGGRTTKFQLLTEDDRADPSQAITVANKLVSLKVNGVIGHLNSGTSIPASYIYNAAGIPQISPSATNPKYTRQGYAGAFRIVADDVSLANTLGKFAVYALKGKTIAVIDDRTAYGWGIAEEFKKSAEAAGGTIVSHEFTTNKATQLNDIMTSLRLKKPDVIFFGGMDDIAGLMLRNMKSLGINAKFIGGDGICTAELAHLAGDGLKDDAVYCAEAGGVEGEGKVGMDMFRTKFRAKFNEDVQVYAPYVYDAVKVMAMAMKSAGSADPAKYLPALKKIKYNGITGTIDFDHKGDLKNGALTIYTYVNKERREIGVVR
jgi:branched-chain amino acid transport system substrate-binding protein